MEERTGAIRMVAFGVLEHKKVVQGEFHPNHFGHGVDQEVEALVCAEFDALGWKLAPMVKPWGNVSKSKFQLLGAVSRTPGLVVRPTIGQGTLQECCQCAITYLETGRTERRYDGEE